jgi:metal-dependent amidase/aminoacylase/carboxypeptidase family protein
VEAFGEEVVIEAVQSMGGEDFSAFQQKAPGSFFMVGAVNQEKGIVYPIIILVLPLMRRHFQWV